MSDNPLCDKLDDMIAKGEPVFPKETPVPKVGTSEYHGRNKLNEILDPFRKNIEEQKANARNKAKVDELNASLHEEGLKKGEGSPGSNFDIAMTDTNVEDYIKTMTPSDYAEMRELATKVFGAEVGKGANARTLEQTYKRAQLEKIYTSPNLPNNRAGNMIRNQIDEMRGRGFIQDGDVNAFVVWQNRIDEISAIRGSSAWETLPLNIRNLDSNDKIDIALAKMKEMAKTDGEKAILKAKAVEGKEIYGTLKTTDAKKNANYALRTFNNAEYGENVKFGDMDAALENIRVIKENEIEQSIRLETQTAEKELNIKRANLREYELALRAYSDHIASETEKGLKANEVINREATIKAAKWLEETDPKAAANIHRMAGNKNMMQNTPEFIADQIKLEIEASFRQVQKDANQILKDNIIAREKEETKLRLEEDRQLKAIDRKTHEDRYIETEKRINEDRAYRKQRDMETDYDKALTAYSNLIADQKRAGLEANAKTNTQAVMDVADIAKQYDTQTWKELMGIATTTDKMQHDPQLIRTYIEAILEDGKRRHMKETLASIEREKDAAVKTWLKEDAENLYNSEQLSEVTKKDMEKKIANKTVTDGDIKLWTNERDEFKNFDFDKIKPENGNRIHSDLSAKYNKDFADKVFGEYYKRQVDIIDKSTKIPTTTQEQEFIQRIMNKELNLGDPRVIEGIQQILAKADHNAVRLAYDKFATVGAVKDLDRNVVLRYASKGGLLPTSEVKSILKFTLIGIPGLYLANAFLLQNSYEYMWQFSDWQAESMDDKISSYADRIEGLDKFLEADAIFTSLATNLLYKIPILGEYYKYTLLGAITSSESWRSHTQLTLKRLNGEYVDENGETHYGLGLLVPKEGTKSGYGKASPAQRTQYYAEHQDVLLGTKDTKFVKAELEKIYGKPGETWGNKQTDIIGPNGKPLTQYEVAILYYKMTGIIPNATDAATLVGTLLMTDLDGYIGTDASIAQKILAWGNDNLGKDKISSTATMQTTATTQPMMTFTQEQIIQQNKELGEKFGLTETMIENNRKDGRIVMGTDGKWTIDFSKPSSSGSMPMISGQQPTSPSTSQTQTKTTSAQISTFGQQILDMKKDGQKPSDGELKNAANEVYTKDKNPIKRLEESGISVEEQSNINRNAVISNIPEYVKDAANDKTLTREKIQSLKNADAGSGATGKAIYAAYATDCGGE